MKYLILPANRVTTKEGMQETKLAVNSQLNTPLSVEKPPISVNSLQLGRGDDT